MASSRRAPGRGRLHGPGRRGLGQQRGRLKSAIGSTSVTVQQGPQRVGAGCAEQERGAVGLLSRDMAVRDGAVGARLVVDDECRARE